jgi:hypothetical protein
MKYSLFLAIGLAALLPGCQSIRDKSDVSVTDATLNRIDPPGTPKTPPAEPKGAADPGAIPGTDKIYYVGDHKIARHETDSRTVLVPEATRRLIAGNAEKGDLSLQPALLDRELAEELARSREINAQNRALMVQMMAASSDLVNAMEQLKKYNFELAQKLEQQIAYSKTLEPKTSETGKNKP